MKQFDLDTWEEILLTITRNKTRSLLTAFGIFWGIFMLISLMGGQKGMQSLMEVQFQGFATNSGFIGASKTSKAYKGLQQGRTWSMDDKDVDRVKQLVPEIDIVTSNITRWGVLVMYQEKMISGTLKGQHPIYQKIEEPQITIGRPINEIDIKEQRRVCVLGSRIYETLFPEKEDPCGKMIQINGIYYQVVGVNMAPGNLSVQGKAETSVIIPFTTMQKNYNRGDKIDLLCFTAKQGYSITSVAKKVEAVVKQAHFVHPDDQQAIICVNAEAMFSMVDNLFLGIKILGWLVGLGTLLAGAIGVSNIMMVTVKERTSEIGIRRAIGAQPKDILQQILSESMVLTILSGMTGISFSVFLLNIVEKAASTPMSPAHFQIDFWGAVGATVLLLLLGILAGLAPAFRALKIKPIDAIRDE